LGDTGEGVMADDKDKTVFGGKVPGAGDPFRPSTPQSRPATGDRTVIGGALPPSGGGRVAPSGGGYQPSTGNTWLGGDLPVQPSSQIGQAPTTQEGFFPQIPSQQAPVEQRTTPRISLEEALRAKGLGKGGPTNPLLAAAANLLILFGRLRTGMVEMHAIPLMEHVTREIDVFEGNAVERGADPFEAQVAKYVLCGTADDIVQNLPGTDRGVWIQYSMVARFFQKRDSGVGFFQEAEKAMQAPGQRFQLLEVMLVCLSLGFEGQYRTLNNGAVELARIRAAIYETLRRVKPRPDEDISVNWTAVPMSGRRKFGGIPIWIVASVSALLIVGAYAALTTLISQDGGKVATLLNKMHPNVASISLIRSAATQVYVPPPPSPEDTTQLDRITASLADQIADGSVEIGTKGDFIFVRVGNTLLFDSGSATVKAAFAELAEHIAATMNAEQGPVRILGYTDDVQPSGRGRYKSNEELSQARAQGVADVLSAQLTDPARVSVEGRGEVDPIADNATPEGRALNRRVEILMAREGTF
jgi:type VI secretion system protein ImpK